MFGGAKLYKIEACEQVEKGFLKMLLEAPFLWQQSEDLFWRRRCAYYCIINGGNIAGCRASYVIENAHLIEYFEAEQSFN